MFFFGPGGVLCKMGTPIPLGVFLLLSLLFWNSQAAGKSVSVCLKLRGERENRQNGRNRRPRGAVCIGFPSAHCYLSSVHTRIHTIPFAVK